MNFLTINKKLKLLLTLLITLLMLSYNTYACDSYVALGKDGRILIMISGDPHSCPETNNLEMVKEWCKQTHEDQSEKKRKLKACNEYFKKHETSWFDKLFSKKQSPTTSQE